MKKYAFIICERKTGDGWVLEREDGIYSENFNSAKEARTALDKYLKQHSPNICKLTWIPLTSIGRSVVKVLTEK